MCGEAWIARFERIKTNEGDLGVGHDCASAIPIPFYMLHTYLVNHFA
jgi:hypothetical protein